MFSTDAGAVIFYLQAQPRWQRARYQRGANPHARLGPLTGVVQQVAQQLLQVLLLASKEQRGVTQLAADVQMFVGIHPLHHPHQAVQHRRNRGALTRQLLRGRDARLRQMPIDMAPCQRQLLLHQALEVIAL